MNDYDVDFFVIGAGSGGVRAARIASGHGAKVMIAEADRVGGTCVIRGCVPKKLMVLAGRFADDFADARGFGWNLGSPRHDWTALIAAKDKEISDRKSVVEGKSVSVRVDLGGSRIIKKKKERSYCVIYMHSYSVQINTK